MSVTKRSDEALRPNPLVVPANVLLAQPRVEDELRRANETLEERTRELDALLVRMRATLESTSDGILVTDRGGHVTDFNERFLELWKMPRPVLERGVYTEVREYASAQLQDPVAFAERVSEIYTTTPDETIDLLKMVDGRILERRSKIQRIQNRVIGRVWSFRDVTEQEHEALTARRLAAIVDCSNDAIVGKDLNLTVTSWNAGAERIFGYTAEEMIGASIMRLIPPDRRNEEEMIRQRIINGARVQPFETVRMAKGGRLIDISVTVSPIKDSSGKVVGASKVARDITERKRAERQLAESHNLLQAVIESTKDAVFLKDLNSRYLLINPAGARYIGKPPEKVIGGVDADFFSAQSAASSVASDHRVIETGESHTYEDPTEINGENRTFLSTKSPYRDANGKIIGIVGLSRDITERKRNEEALQAAKNDAEKANRAKSEFLSRMSHELRTPLNAIIGFGQLLETDDLTSEQHEHSNLIVSAGRHLLGLINDVLDISRIEAGRLDLSLEPVPLYDLVQEAATLVRSLASRAQLHLINEIPEEANLFVMADRQRLKQVLLNLLSNAIKYNRPGGEVRIRSRVLDQDGSPTICVDVVDNGIGMSPQNVERLFTPFDRLGAERTNVEGTGLGLALSKRLIEIMGASISVKSEPGAGSTFSVTLAKAEDPASALVFDEETIERPRSVTTEKVILYIEDNLSNLKLIERVLARRGGVQLIAAMQGRLGLELASEHHPDLILLDVHLPDINGREVLEQLRAKEETRDIPVIVVSADATAGQIERLQAAGADKYLTKPIDVRQFNQIIDEVWETTKAK